MKWRTKPSWLQDGQRNLLTMIETLKLVPLSIVYLSHKLKLDLYNQIEEIKRRNGLVWGRSENSSYNNNLKRKKFETWVLPVLTWGTEMLTLTKTSGNEFRVAQRAMNSTTNKNRWCSGKNDMCKVELDGKYCKKDRRTLDYKRIMNWRPPIARPRSKLPER